MLYVNFDVYIFFKICHDFFQNFLSFLCSVLHISHETDPSRRDRFVSVPAESVTETATLNDAPPTPRYEQETSSGEHTMGHKEER